MVMLSTFNLLMKKIRWHLLQLMPAPNTGVATDAINNGKR